jgi:hypothetical protein
MFKEDPTHRAVLLGPRNLAGGSSKLLLKKLPTLVPQTVNDVTGTSLVVVVKLGARTFKKSVVVEEHEPPQNLLQAAAQEADDLRGTKKTMTANQPENSQITLRQV